MKNLPQIHYWKEQIDRAAWSFHAVRGWGDRPSNGVFMLVPHPTAHYFSWSEREAIRAELEVRLKERECILLNWFGPRDWRNHLCARIIRHGERIYVRDDFEFA